MSTSTFMYGYASPVTTNTAPAITVGAVRRGSTINGLTSRTVSGKAERTDIALAKGLVGPLFFHSPCRGDA